MKKTILIIASMILSSQLWASGLIECKFDSNAIYKMTVLLNEGSNGVTIQFLGTDEYSQTYIEGREGESVRFNSIGDSGQFILQASNNEPQKLSITAIFTPGSQNRRMGVELFTTEYGETHRELGGCFAVTSEHLIF